MIAIDGPAASGKSSIGKMLADKLGYLFFDTGVLYRAVTWAALHQKISCSNEESLTELIAKTIIEVGSPSQKDGRSADIIIDGQDHSADIHSQEVDSHVSEVAKHAKVRMALTTKMRQIGLSGNVVMVGRDVGTVILPEAEMKIYLEASAEERARRRYKEQTNKGEHPITYQQVLDTLLKRDYTDSHRAIAPLKAAEDALLIDTDGITQEKVICKITQYMELQQEL